MKVKVQKYDPSSDSKPYYVSGEVPFKENMTALEVLQYFHENVEAINFEYNCACRLCGRCAMMINGESKMACVTKVEDSSYVFEPLAGYPVIRDLVVDKSSADKRLSNISNRVRLQDYGANGYDTPTDFDYANRDLIYALEYCARCGACTASCPAHQTNPKDYIGPMGEVAIAYRYFDPLDQGDRVLEAVGNGLFHCIECGTCDAMCAQHDIHHVELFKLLKDAARAKGMVPDYAEE